MERFKGCTQALGVNMWFLSQSFTHYKGSVYSSMSFGNFNVHVHAYSSCHFFSLGSSLHQLSKYIPVLLHHVSNLEFDGDATVYSTDHTPLTGKGRGVRGGTSIVTAVMGRSGEKMDLGQVSTNSYVIVTIANFAEFVHVVAPCPFLIITMLALHHQPAPTAKVGFLHSFSKRCAG